MSKTISLLAQVQTIRANVDLKGSVVDRVLMLTVLQTKPSSPPMGYATPHYAAAVYGLRGGDETPFALTLSTADSNSIKAGDWLSVKVTQLTEEEQNQLAKTLVERSDTMAKAEALRNADSEESKKMISKFTLLAEQQLKKLGEE